MSMRIEDWQAANQEALVAALLPVYAALCRAAGQEQSAEPAGSPPATADPPFAIETLCRQFALTAFERDLLLLCAGVELDGRFAEACSLIHRDPKRTAPTFGLALAVLPGAHWSALTRDRPLRYWRMIEPLAGESLAGSPLRIDERILHYLTGIASSDERLAGIVQALDPPGRLPPWLLGSVEQAAHALRAGDSVLLTGRSAADRETVAAGALLAAGFAPFRIARRRPARPPGRARNPDPALEP